MTTPKPGDGYLQLGNTDLEASCTWVPTDVQAGTTPLPECQHHEVLRTIPLTTEQTS